MYNRPTATPELIEVVASGVQDVVGIWTSFFEGKAAYIEFKSDGTWTVSSTLEGLAGYGIVNGEFWFEGDVLTVNDTLCREVGTYQAFAQSSEEGPVALRIQVISDPKCPERVRDWRRGMRRVEP